MDRITLDVICLFAAVIAEIMKSEEEEDYGSKC